MMTADINREQLILLAQCVLFGAGAGLCYDVFRGAARALPGKGGRDGMRRAVLRADARGRVPVRDRKRRRTVAPVRAARGVCRGSAVAGLPECGGSAALSRRSGCAACGRTPGRKGHSVVLSVDER